MNFTEEVELRRERLTQEAAQNDLGAVIFLCCLAVVGIVGNSILLDVYLHVKRKVLSTYFIACLASIDLFISLAVLPLRVMLFYVVVHPAICGLYLSMAYVFVSTSILLFVCIAFDRYQSVCLLNRQFLMKKHLKFIGIYAACSDMYPLVAAPLFLKGEVTLANGNQTTVLLMRKDRPCYITGLLSSPERQWDVRYIIHFACAIFYVLLMVVVVVFYSLIFKTLRGKDKCRLSTQAVIQPLPVENSCPPKKLIARSCYSERSHLCTESKITNDQSNDGLVISAGKPKTRRSLILSCKAVNTDGFCQDLTSSYPSKSTVAEKSIEESYNNMQPSSGAALHQIWEEDHSRNESGSDRLACSSSEKILQSVVGMKTSSSLFINKSEPSVKSDISSSDSVNTSKDYYTITDIHNRTNRCRWDGDTSCSSERQPYRVTISQDNDLNCASTRNVPTDAGYISSLRISPSFPGNAITDEPMKTSLRKRALLFKQFYGTSDMSRDGTEGRFRKLYDINLRRVVNNKIYPDISGKHRQKKSLALTVTSPMNPNTMNTASPERRLHDICETKFQRETYARQSDTIATSSTQESMGNLSSSPKFDTSTVCCQNCQCKMLNRDKSAWVSIVDKINRSSGHKATNESSVNRINSVSNLSDQRSSLFMISGQDMNQYQSITSDITNINKTSSHSRLGHSIKVKKYGAQLDKGGRNEILSPKMSVVRCGWPQRLTIAASSSLWNSNWNISTRVSLRLFQVTLIYCLCWLPFYLIELGVVPYNNVLLQVFFLGNVINPLIHFTTSANFRREAAKRIRRFFRLSHTKPQGI